MQVHLTGGVLTEVEKKASNEGRKKKRRPNTLVFRAQKQTGKGGETRQVRNTCKSGATGLHAANGHHGERGPGRDGSRGDRKVLSSVESWLFLT